MECHEFKGGIGTSSRKVGEYVVGALVQCNYGYRETLTIAGVPVGVEIADLIPEYADDAPAEATGSIIVVVATDAPLLAHQLKRLARRIPMGIARVGGVASNGSGDIFLAFSTANPGAADREKNRKVEMMPNDKMTPLFEATIQATEESIVNAMVAARTMTGINGNTVHALPHQRLRQVLKKYNRLQP
jgi:L-aminopeptidase/D-esterase-like protein